MAVVRKSAATAERQPVTISFAGFNRAWAAWIGDRLERQGHLVSFARWDPPPGTTIEQALEDLMLAEGKILVILSDWYFQLGPRTHEEWNKALRAVVATNTDRFAAVSVTNASLPTATAALSASSLWGIGAHEAERRLLARIGTPDTAPAEDAPNRSSPRFPYDQPRVWGGVPRRNIRFTGRENLLGDVYHRLQQAEQGAAVVTLLGMSGVGKTQIAAEYVYRFGSEYDAVWWVPADQRGTLRQRLAELAPALGLTTGPEYGERLRAVLDALRRGNPYSRWLLVLDGADQVGDIADLLPSGPGHVLITSQNRAWGEHNTALMEIPVYSRDESVAFVRRRAGRLDEGDANRLAEALEDLPLLLDQTAGWLSDSTMSVDEYIGLLTTGSNTEAGLKVAADFPMTFQTAWSILLNQLRDTEPASIELLRLCVFFAPGPIPVRLLRELPMRDLPEQLVGLMNDPLRWNDATAKLVQYSVVRRESHDVGGDEPGGGSEILHMHRMVHQTVRDGMPEADRREYADVVRRALAAADPGRPTDTRLWPRYAELTPHLKAAGVLESTDPDVQQLVLNSLRYMYLSGEYKSGLKLAERTMAAWKELLGELHPRIWDIVHHYSNLLHSTGDYAKAEAISRIAVDHLREERGQQDLDLLRAASGLAASLRGLARYDEAYEVSRLVLEGYLDLVGERDSRTLSARSNLAVSVRLLGRYEESLDLNRQTLDTRRDALRPRHNWTLLSEIHYAWDLRLLGRYEESVSVQDRSVRTHRDVMGPDNPQTLRAEHNLAMGQYRAGDRLRAQALLARLLERVERVLGENDPLSLMVASSYSCVAREHGDLDSARAVGEAVTRRYRATLGSSHPYVLGSLGNHGLVLRAAGERQQSQELVEEALTGMNEAVGPDHPWTLGCALNATATRNFSGDPEGAAELSRDTAARAAATLGGIHPLTLSSRIALAADLRALRKRQEAEKVEEEALATLAVTLGAQHVHTVSARSRTRPFWDFEPQIT
ncbi:FxSxx-COOH system tetratricopeptide repeat protein [Streptomyces sp. H10-C2]|uniref:FxSxx-COOH system tetratricopeptide repeat protein n=1 Tax=unclassified Streptomyces TaxID=2593676 RepID=UPI0024B948BC|nr:MULTISPECIES: FxSxx-COOH system tetratricopeptide repeat protein [unclassified Streptomyces]MDJ0342505.1 FxSxx-COOH system tetratricopeptide repeat protein [Streptomyces sp. PH10-H1]MDJ0370583.1 FxSxx-COOH system tetratricopeptide repeat protein [Streptomyces sp. H10-C2]